MQQLDAAQQRGQELVNYPSLEAVPEVASKLVIDCDAVTPRGESCLLYSPQILHAVDPNCKLHLLKS